MTCPAALPILALFPPVVMGDDYDGASRCGVTGAILRPYTIKT